MPGPAHTPTHCLYLWLCLTCLTALATTDLHPQSGNPALNFPPDDVTTIASYVDFMTQTRLRRHAHRHVIAGVIMPHQHHQFRWQLVHAALEEAKDLVHRTPALLENFTLTFDLRDSGCSDTYGPLMAIDMVTRQAVDVFLGPHCDYVVAPVARFTKVWNVPLISAGGTAGAFGNKANYPLLTRVMGDYAKGAEFVVSVLDEFQWEVVGMLYHDNENQNLGKSECWFQMEAVYLLLNKGRDNANKIPIQNTAFFDENSARVDYEFLLKKLSRFSRGKINVSQQAQ